MGNLTRERVSTGRPGFAPVDLGKVPAVDALLERLGLGPFDRDSLVAPVGRNEVWAGGTAGGRKVFVKRLVGGDDDIRARMRRLLSFERFSAELSSSALRGPEFLGCDEEARIVAFEYLEGARSGAELMVDETFDDALAHAVGRAIGLLHDSPVREPGDLDGSAPELPSPALLQALPQRMFDNLSFGELQTWRLMQSDSALIAAVTDLRAREEEAPRVPAHCDLRVDQLLVTDEAFYVADWEEFRLADPARDVGGFAGEWLYRSILDIATSRGDTVFMDTDLTHESVLRRGAEKIERLRPRIQNFWYGYRETAGRADAELAARATAFAGWHMLDRMIAGSPQRARISGIERAAAGVGRGILLNPERFAATLGLGERA
ncbi:class V lanthionine synthetase subunit LxmK [Streptomyces sp. NBC_00467]|uniref:class V lanthionine synthetase subunit LxmK n=1 Tax=Streptomyces sp. NBC_00467 TaxID=2975752 RepID=UPI002E18DF45